MERNIPLGLQCLQLVKVLLWNKTTFNRWLTEWQETLTSSTLPRNAATSERTTWVEHHSILSQWHTNRILSALRAYSPADSQSVSQSKCLSYSISFRPYFNSTVFNYHFFQCSIVRWKTEASKFVIVFIVIIQFISLCTRCPFYIYSTEFIYIYSDPWRQTEMQLSII